jgi:hypothetical protein
MKFSTLVVTSVFLCACGAVTDGLRVAVRAMDDDVSAVTATRRHGTTLAMLRHASPSETSVTEPSRCDATVP